jgi:hypothetical protein
MANQKITDLNKSDKLSNEDLFIVVDKDEYGTSPTGETKAITAQILAEQLALIKHDDVGIRFSELADVPNEYQEAAGAFVKISDTGNGVEFTESPGHSEIAVDYSDFYQNIETTQAIIYRVGDVLCRDLSTNKFKHASSENSDDAEVIGVIRKIKRDVDGVILKVNVAFGGHIVFEEPVYVEKYQLDTSDIVATESVLIGGKTYFLGRGGKLADFDPAEQLMDTDPHISKPLIIATGPQAGVFVNYRGLVCEKTDQPNKFVVEYSTSCSKIKVGDVVRVRRKIQRNPKGGFGDALEKTSEFEGVAESVLPSYLDFESGDSPYVLANAASQNTPDSISLEDSFGCEYIGIVTLATSDFFQIQTSGMIKFEIPSGLTDSEADVNTKPNALFKRGYTYYLESFDISTDVNSYAEQSKQLRRTVYDYSADEMDDWFSNKIGDSNIDGVSSGINPFRNTTINNPFRRDPDTRQVVSYAKPVFYAVSEDQILLLNHPVYPTPYDTCNAINPELNEPCVQHTTTKDFTTQKTGVFIADTWLNNEWPLAQKQDVAIVNLIDFGQNRVEKLKYTKIANNISTTQDGETVVNYGNWEKVETS